MIYTKQIRIANIDGTNDHSILGAANDNQSFTFAQYCSDGKIVFVQQEFMGGVISEITKVMNEDGSGIADSNISPRLKAITGDRKYYATDVFSSTNIQIIDTTGDGGAGTVVYSQPYDDSHPAMTFTNDGKYCLITYAVGTDIKMDIVDMMTFAATPFTLAAGVGAPSYSVYALSMGADNRTGVFTISGDFPKSKSYVFDIVTKTVKAPFLNNAMKMFRRSWHTEFSLLFYN